jgi:mannose-6-phosphate isomerase
VLPPNPAWRSYLGGRVLREFRGQPGTGDDHFPEDWLASTVRARNGADSQGPNEGLSCLGEPFAGQLLADALQVNPGFWWGMKPPPASGTGVLWKLLDSSVRLQLQAHPDARFARTHLDSNAGKTECWYILETRGEAHIYLGFQRAPNRDVWERMIREQRVDEMLACFDPIPVRPGDCFVVPAGTPHAIGAGVFMMELQEPTDWVVRCEFLNAGLRLPESACFMGLDLETCLDVFRYESLSVEEVRGRWQQHPRTIRQEAGFTESEIIRPDYHGFFRLHRLQGHGDASWPGNELQLLLVTRGAGKLATADAQQPVCSGQTWLLPGAADRWFWQGGTGDWEILLAKTPINQAASNRLDATPTAGTT